MVAIPSGVFNKYAEFADGMLNLTTGFGTQCQLVYTDKIEVITNDVPNFKQKRVFDVQSMNPDSGFSRGSKKFKTVETTENITLRVYWDEKEFKKFGNISIPEGGVMAIGNYSELAKIRKAAFLLIETAKTGHAQWKFEKAAEPTVHGLDSDYLMSYWKRV
ncbi:MAG: hypothetical protein CMC15_15930 [Flavobacteriaceae bacterium]|jgi:hypothetical protein|nr:hypothetical protein [Flavobacteriaceae bacterium]|tara:strand:+ start:207 stop:689 length:483 start_codon:yes stop_codon:yes gene_type:complete